MDGLLIVDKPAGPTSHDVVAASRRALARAAHRPHRHARPAGHRRAAARRRPRHAPRAFPERATRRTSATMRLGVRHRHLRRAGQADGRRSTGRCRRAKAIDAALDAFRGTFMQQPPAYSAKKIAGQRSYALARRSASAAAPDEPPGRPAAIAAGARARDRARDRARGCRRRPGDAPRDAARPASTSDRWPTTSGERLGTGAHLAALRRTRSGDSRSTRRSRWTLIQSEARPRSRGRRR